MTEEHRHFSRIHFQTRTRLSAGSLEWDCELIDISLKGALIECPPGWSGQIGDPYTLEIQLGDDAETIRMQASLAHMEDGHAGFHCVHIDIDSITHLRRLLELNLGDAELLNRELAALG